MRRVVTSVALLALAPVCLTTAHASDHSARNCDHLITSPRGDAYMWFLPTKPYNAEADLLSVDATTSARTVDFTLRMASVNPQPTTGTGVTIYFTTNNQGHRGDWYVDMTHAIDGTSYSVQDNNTNQVTPTTGAVNAPAGTYLLRVPRAAIDATYRGAVLDRLGVIVSQDVGVDAAGSGFIEQSTGPGYHYRVGYPYGCSRR